MNYAPPAPKTFTAESDLTLYRFVKLGAAANGVTACTAITDVAHGVAVENVDASEADAASVWLLNEGGIVPVEAAAAISLGAKVAPSANGRAQTAVATQFPRGIALEAASGAGHVIPVLVSVEETAVV
jgi:hypothetical protein